jgi:hypothetical protein
LSWQNFSQSALFIDTASRQLKDKDTKALRDSKIHREKYPGSYKVGLRNEKMREQLFRLPRQSTIPPKNRTSESACPENVASIARASYKDLEIPKIWQIVPEIDGTFVTIWALPKCVTLYPPNHYQMSSLYTLT